LESPDFEAMSGDVTTRCPVERDLEAMGNDPVCSIRAVTAAAQIRPAPATAEAVTSLGEACTAHSSEMAAIQDVLRAEQAVHRVRKALNVLRAEPAAPPAALVAPATPAAVADDGDFEGMIGDSLVSRKRNAG
jgi:hypothetical protein